MFSADAFWQNTSSRRKMDQSPAGGPAIAWTLRFCRSCARSTRRNGASAAVL